MELLGLGAAIGYVLYLIWAFTHAVRVQRHNILQAKESLVKQGNSTTLANLHIWSRILGVSLVIALILLPFVLLVRSIVAIRNMRANAPPKTDH
ncbi:MAG: hypothetical protein HYT49_02515 [Candidatus Wildermuthbacteria bacterium]|nr:hypothetical protein [Candidatus Wildermuthbacteria bacterium]